MSIFNAIYLSIHLFIYLSSLMLSLQVVGFIISNLKIYIIMVDLSGSLIEIARLYGLFAPSSVLEIPFKSI